MKLNKKGFTLIELLAVIVVTSLVLGLSSYGIISAYNKSKEKVIVLNEASILEAARIQSSEANSEDWKTLNDKEYFCTTIQRLKNAGLLKKEAKSEEHEDFSLITVERNTSTLNIVDTNFVDDTSLELTLLCNIKYFTIHYDYNVSDESGYVPKDQHGEVCNDRICEGISISSVEPKRKGYRFVGWNTESDGSGVLYQSGDNFSSKYEETITLYAQWTEDIYTIRYNANITSATGSTSNTTCVRDSNCTLTQNGFSKNGYTFTGWNTKSNGTGKTYKDKEVVRNITSSSTITLYAQWKPRYKVIIKFNTGGGNITSSTTSSSGVNYRWRKDSNGIISRSENGGSYTSEFFTIGYSESENLPNYNNTHYMNITRSGYGVSSGSVWKCTEGECNGTTYNQTSSYNSNSFCNASSSDCTVTLTVNWENQNILSPIITASDGILSNEWHCSSYTLSISSENSGSVSYQYKVGSGSYKTYSSPISPSNGVSTYTARTKSGTNYSGTVSYVSKIDSTAPSAPTITRSINGSTVDVTNKGSNDIPWVNANFSVTLHSTDNESELAYYQYKYSNTDWVTYANSTDEYFTTTDFSINRDEFVFFRACNSCGKCSEESKTYIKLDKTKPVVTSIDNSSGENWTKENVVLTLHGSDSSSAVTSGIDHYEYKYSGGNWNTYSNSAMETFEAPAISQEGKNTVYIRVKDKAGNYSDSKETLIRIDKTAPNIPTITNPTNGEWVNYNFALTLSSSDDASGLYRYEYKYANTDWTEYSTPATNQFTTSNFSLPRNELVYIRVRDNAGNYSDTSSTYIRIDKTNPTFTFKMKKGSSSGSEVSASSNEYSLTQSNSLKWINYIPYLEWTTSDTGGSGINTSVSYNFSYNGTNLSTLSTNISGKLTISGDSNGVFGTSFSSNGYRYFILKICDNANNCVNSEVYVKFDNGSPNAPTIKRSINGSTVDVTNKNKNEIPWTNQNISLSVSSTDSVSGIDYYQYSYDQSSWNTYSGGAFTSERDQDVYIKVWDKAGNSAVSHTPIRIDKTAPSLIFQMLNGSTAVASTNYSDSASNSLEWINFEPTLKWTASDSASGINTSGTSYWNASKNETINENFYGNETISGTQSGNNYVFNAGEFTEGYRKVKMKVCDIAGNCAENTKYFKCAPKSRYVTWSGGLNCYSDTSKTSVVTDYSCGDDLGWLMKTNTGNWYYKGNAGCYLDGDYLSTSRPSCSSGGGEGTYSHCTYCDTEADCSPLSGYTKKCVNNYCYYYSGGVPLGQGCE